MIPYYYNELPSMPAEEGLIALGMIILGTLGVVLLFGLLFWVLSSLSLHKIARRRGIRHAWLAWLPIGGQWILGSLSDQYQHLVQGKITSRRKLLLILNLAAIVIGIGYVVAGAVVGAMIGVGGRADMTSLLMLIPYFLFLGTVIANMVFYHICNYDLYRSCKPESAVVFLVLGIILPVCQPFFYFACRKKDLGMIVPKPAAHAESAELPRVDPEF